MMIMVLVSVDICRFAFAFTELKQISLAYKPVGKFLSFVGKSGLSENVLVIHRKPHSCTFELSSFQHLFQHVVIVINLGMFIA